MLTAKYVKLTDSMLIFLGSLLLFTFGLSQQEVVGFDSRLYAFALEIWRHGLDWFPRTFQIQYYPDYPVTSSLMIYFFARGVGALNKLVAILPSAIAASLTLVVTYYIGALQNRRWAWNAVILLLFTLAFVSEARAIAYDQYITLVTTLAFFLVCSQKTSWALARFSLLFLLFVIGFAFRGPIGLVIPTGVVCIFYLIEKDFKKFFVIGMMSALLLIICTMLFLTLAYHAGGIEFLQDVLRAEVLGHIHDIKSNPAYFYFVESFGVYAVTYPLMVLMLPGVLWMIFKKNGQKQSELKFLLHLLGWVLVILIGLSIPDDKKIRYILPMAPALALFCAYLISDEVENLYLRFLRKFFYWCCYFLPTICLFGLVFFYKRLLFAHLSYLSLIALFLSLQVILFVCYFCWRKKISFILFVAMITFVATYLFIVEPINIVVNSAHGFVLTVENLRKKEHLPLVFYHEGMDTLAVKYFINMPQEEKLFFIDTPDELMRYQEPAIFIASVEYVEALPENVRSHFKQVMVGAIGHDKVIVFRRVGD